MCVGRGWRGIERECLHAGERESERVLGSSFICFLPPEPPLCKLGSARSAVLPEVLTQVLGPSFGLFSWAFPFLVF